MDKVQVKKPGRKPRNQKAFDRIIALEKGESLIMKVKDWKLATPPGANIIRRYTNREFQVQTLIDDSGWQITAL